MTPRLDCAVPCIPDSSILNIFVGEGDVCLNPPRVVSSLINRM